MNILLTLKHDIMKIGHFFMILFARLIKNDECYLRLMYFLKTHRRLRLEPYENMRFTEKLQWLKLFGFKSEFTNYVDKFGVKDIFKDVMIPTLGVYERFDEINFDCLPNQFVIKCTHDSGGLVICKDKAKLDLVKAKKKIEICLKSNFFNITREYPYKDVPRRIIVEEYIEDEQGKDLVDYKFFCFNGKAKYCQIIADRSTNETIDFYDRQWIHQDFIGLLPTAHHAPIAHHVPINYDQMLNLADNLASKVDSPFVRIDLYNIKGKIYLGEITFYPASGFGCFRPAEWDIKLGKMLHLPINNNNDNKNSICNH